MDKFLDLLAQSVIVQGLVTLVLIIAVVIQVITTNQVNSFLQNLTELVIGFWFGAKIQNGLQNLRGNKKPDE